MENLLKNIEILREQIEKTIKLLDIERKRARSIELKSQMNNKDFWQNRQGAIAVSKEAEQLEIEVSLWDKLKQETLELEELVAEGERINDESISSEAHELFKKLAAKFKKLEFSVLFSGKYDQHNAILSIHAGTGGVDAQDWAEMLMRMFLRFVEKKNWQASITEKNIGSEAGIKNSTLHIRGSYAYGYLKSESGVHRLVRISPFDAESMRHTSFALVEVIPELPEAKNVEVSEADLKIDVYRSSGPGGQGVNTTDSAVRITHIPTGIVVTCQNERSQHQNKETAMRILKAKLFQQAEQEKEKKEKKLKGESQKAEWGKQIRSYVLQPYKMVKDHRSEHESQEVEKVLDGGLDEFIEAFLKWSKNN